jgi:DNA/RNA-binding domain of Phe-tRNA-synthetase-like protein
MSLNNSEMKVTLTSELKTVYHDSIFGSLVVENVENIKKDDRLEALKRELEKSIRESSGEENTMKSYDTYFKRWGKTYPIEFQIKTIKNGGSLPQVSLLVDSMFLAELKNKILTSGHDLDSLKENLFFDVSKGGEEYIKLNGEKQVLKENDIILKDDEGVLASVLYGPARRTSISPSTRNALYFAWCPCEVSEDAVSSHLKDILSNIQTVVGVTNPKINIFQKAFIK